MKTPPAINVHKVQHVFALPMAEVVDARFQAVIKEPETSSFVQRKFFMSLVALVFLVLTLMPFLAVMEVVSAVNLTGVTNPLLVVRVYVLHMAVVVDVQWTAAISRLSRLQSFV